MPFNTAQPIGELCKNRSSGTSDIAPIVMAQYIIRNLTLCFKAKHGALAVSIGRAGLICCANKENSHFCLFAAVRL